MALLSLSHRREKGNRTARAAVVTIQPAIHKESVSPVSMVLGVYILIGVLLAVLWSGESAIRHIGGLKSFIIIVAAWPAIICGLIIAGRNF
jgi:hypothetical protein